MRQVLVCLGPLKKTLAYQKPAGYQSPVCREEDLKGSTYPREKKKKTVAWRPAKNGGSKGTGCVSQETQKGVLHVLN